MPEQHIILSRPPRSFLPGTTHANIDHYSHKAGGADWDAQESITIAL